MGFAIQHDATCKVAAVDELLAQGRAHRLAAMAEAALWVLGRLLVGRALNGRPVMPRGYPVGSATRDVALVEMHNQASEAPADVVIEREVSPGEAPDRLGSRRTAGSTQCVVTLKLGNAGGAVAFRCEPARREVPSHDAMTIAAELLVRVRSMLDLHAADRPNPSRFRTSVSTESFPGPKTTSISRIAPQ